MNKRKKEEYGIFPPYIDAYIKSWGNKITFESFCAQMKSHASSWGEQSIGAASLSGVDIPKSEDGRTIVCIGWFGDKNFAVVVNPESESKERYYWFQNMEVIEFNWPGEWDVT